MTAGIDTYDELQAVVDRTLKSSTLTPEIPAMIALAERTLRRRLKIGAARVTATLIPSGGVLALPADFGGVVDLKVPGAAFPVEQVAFQYIQALPERSGLTELWAVGGAQMLFWPIAPASVSLTYVQKLTPLSADEPTNWLLAEHYDAYLYAALVESELFNMNDARMPMWKAKLDEAIAEIRRDDDEQLWGRGPLVCRRVA